MHVGIIAELFCDKGYGKIETEGCEDVHFHKHCLWDIPFEDLTKGQEVEFEMQSSHKGFLAFHIRPHVQNELFKV